MSTFATTADNLADSQSILEILTGRIHDLDGETEISLDVEGQDGIFYHVCAKVDSITVSESLNG